MQINARNAVFFRLLLALACLSGLGSGTFHGWAKMPAEPFHTNGIMPPAISADQAIERALEISPEKEALVDGYLPDISYGANDFRISEAGLLDEWGSAFYPDVAYNEIDEQYLVVWEGSESIPPQDYREYEIYGQFISAADGADIGTDFRISVMGPDGNAGFDALHPAVTYNETQNEFLVVWESNHNLVGLDPYEREIWGQRVDGATHLLNAPVVRLSFMGGSGDSAYNTANPDVAWASQIDEYLVVWEGDDNSGALVDGEYEIFGERLEGDTAGPIEEIQISKMGPDGNPNYDASRPAVVYNSTGNEYFVVWSADDDNLADNENEIYAQRIKADTGDQLGVDDRRISDMGPNNNDAYEAEQPVIAYNEDDNLYLVAWIGDDNIAPLVEGEYEVFTQLLNGLDGAEMGPNDQRISTMGPDGNVAYGARWVDVVYNGLNEDFLVVWNGDDNTGSLADEENEVFGQRIDGFTGLEKGTDDLRISDMGGDGDTKYDGEHPAVAHNMFNNQYLVVWDGSDNVAPLSDAETEIFGQRLTGATASETGANDRRISEMWYDDPRDFIDAEEADAAYNSFENYFMVVWECDLRVSGETEICARAIDADSGEALSKEIRISRNDPWGDPAYDNLSPAIAFNSYNGKFLVVWEADTNTPPHVDEEYEIMGILFTYAGGLSTFSQPFYISDMGAPGSALYDAYEPDVAYNSQDDEFLVVWHADDNTGLLVDGEFEIYGQRLSGDNGEERLPDDFRISDMNVDGNVNFNAWQPAVAYNVSDNEYLVVWQGDDGVGGLADNESEIYGQLLNASTGAEVLPNDFRISHMGPDGNNSYNAYNPGVAYNSANQRYLVVWSGDTNIPAVPLVDEEYEIFGQQIDAANGSIIGTNFRISDMGPDGNASFDATLPAVVYDAEQNTYLISWKGDTALTGLVEASTLPFASSDEAETIDKMQPEVDGEYEIFAQCLDAEDRSELFPFNERLSDMGSDGSTLFKADLPSAAVNAESMFLVVWYGDDNTPPLVDNNYQVFGQMVLCTRNWVFMPVVLR